MRKLLLTFLFCMIGLSSFGLELRCKHVEEIYFRVINDEGVLEDVATPKEVLSDITIKISDSSCKWAQMTEHMILEKTDYEYKCTFSDFLNNELISTAKINIDRYSGKLIYKWLAKGNATSHVYQCEKLVKRKF